MSWCDNVNNLSVFKSTGELVTWAAQLTANKCSVTLWCVQALFSEKEYLAKGLKGFLGIQQTILANYLLIWIINERQLVSAAKNRHQGSVKVSFAPLFCAQLICDLIRTVGFMIRCTPHADAVLSVSSTKTEHALFISVHTEWTSVGCI